MEYKCVLKKIGVELVNKYGGLKEDATPLDQVKAIQVIIEEAYKRSKEYIENEYSTKECFQFSECLIYAMVLKTYLQGEIVEHKNRGHAAFLVYGAIVDSDGVKRGQREYQKVTPERLAEMKDTYGCALVLFNESELAFERHLRYCMNHKEYCWLLKNNYKW